MKTDGSEEVAGIKVPIGGKVETRKDSEEEPVPEEILRLLSERKKAPAERTVLEKIEARHVMRILLYLDRMSPVMKTDIYNDISRCSNMAGKLQDLVEMGLIKLYTTGHVNSSVAVITPKGREVAAKVRELIEYIESGE